MILSWNGRLSRGRGMIIPKWNIGFLVELFFLVSYSVHHFNGGLAESNSNFIIVIPLQPPLFCLKHENH
jgi:tellurite resistance protein TehA-like permease